MNVDNQQQHYCLNCESPFGKHEKFCSQCGQKTNTHRLNFHELVHEIQHSVFHVDSGIFYTLKELILRPGQMVKSYLAGKRTKHFKPVLLVLILSAIYTFFIFKMIHLDHIVINGQIPNDINSNPNSAALIKKFTYISQQINAFYKEKYGFVMLGLVPLLALSFQIGFLGTKKYNYVEYVFISLFMTAQSLLILIPTQLLIHYIPGLKTFNGIENLLVILASLWMVRGIYNELSFGNVLLRTLVSYIMFIVIATAIMFAIALIGIFIV